MFSCNVASVTTLYEGVATASRCTKAYEEEEEEAKCTEGDASALLLL